MGKFIMKLKRKRKSLKFYLRCLNSNLKGLNDMDKKDIYDWPEGEDDNIDFDAIHEQNKDKTVEDLDREWEEFVRTLKLERID